MATKNEAWGVEVGAQAIKAMKLVRSGDGVALEDFDVLPFKHVLTTPDLNVEEAIRVNLEALAQKHEFGKSTTVVSVPGNMAFARFAKLPPIEATKVKSIVAYEAQQQIPFPIDEVEWDYQVFAQDDAPDIEVGIFAITKERVANFLSNYRSVDMRVDTLTLSPVAVYNAFAFENELEASEGDSTVYLDIGSVSTDIIVVEDGGIWLRTLPLGGNHFTNALMKQFKISFAKAEKLKLEAGTSKYAKQIFQAMRGVFSDLVTEVQRSLGFYTSLNRDSELTRIVGVGSTWKLPGLQKYLKQNLQMKVTRPDGFSRLNVEDRRAAEFSSVAVNMATAYGLALQGLGMGAVDANILPQSVLRQRMWKAKQPWIGAAAACVAGAAALGPVKLFLESNSYNAAWGSVEQDINQTVAQAQQLKSSYDTVQTTDPRPGIRNFRRGLDYTNLYPKLVEDVSAAMSAIKPNEAIADVNWNNPADLERVANVPREQRGLVWITNIETDYQAPLAVAMPFDDGSDEYSDMPPQEMPNELASGSFGLPSAGPTGLTPVIPFPNVPKAEAEPVETPDPGASDLPADIGQGVATTQAPDPSPRIIVTVRGETTMDGATISRLLQQQFVGWMKDNAKRNDRPYVLVAELKEPRFNRRGVASTSEANTGGAGGSGLTRTPQATSTESDAGLPTPGLITPGQPGPGSDPLGGIITPGTGTDKANSIEVKTPEGWYATLGQSTGFSIGALLPQRPLAIEDNSNDYVFTFRFEVILLSPDEARKTILPVAEEPGSDEQTEQPTAAAQTNGSEVQS